MQVHATNAEMDERISRFIENKREDINNANILEFCGHQSEKSQSCARTNAVLTKKRDSKSHLRKSSVINTFMNPMLDERLESLESSVDCIKPVPKDVYARLKALEDRLIILERISPKIQSSHEIVKETYENERREELTQNLIDINDEMAQLKDALMS